MDVEAIGRNLSRSGSSATSGVNQEEFVRLFVTQLQFQDPTEPVDNAQFLAQLAQFTTVSQLAENGATLNNISFLDSVNQGANLLGRTVQVSVQSGIVVGEVTQVEFSEKGPALTVRTAAAQDINGVRLSQIQLIRK